MNIIAAIKRLFGFQTKGAKAPQRRFTEKPSKTFPPEKVHIKEQYTDTSSRTTVKSSTVTSNISINGRGNTVINGKAIPSFTRSDVFEKTQIQINNDKLTFTCVVNPDKFREFDDIVRPGIEEEFNSSFERLNGFTFRITKK